MRVIRGAIEIKITTTGRTPIGYVLAPQKQYQIYWNASKGVWDVSELVVQE
jgi:hypothetical protein